MGGITALFKKKKFDKLTTPVESIPETEPAPVAPPGVDLSGLDDRERLVIEARSEGKTLKEVGKELRISAERVRHRRG
jgi:DNA-binding NarL/FixJ family response regulator